MISQEESIQAAIAGELHLLDGNFQSAGQMFPRPAREKGWRLYFHQGTLSAY